MLKLEKLRNNYFKRKKREMTRWTVKVARLKLWGPHGHKLRETGTSLSVCVTLSHL